MGHGHPMWTLFGENVCENERIGSCRGGGMHRNILCVDPPMHDKALFGFFLPPSQDQCFILVPSTVVTASVIVHRRCCHLYFKLLSLADPGSITNVRPPPTGSNSFIFTNIFAKKRPGWRLAPPQWLGAPNRKSRIHHWLCIGLPRVIGYSTFRPSFRPSVFLSIENHW